MRPGVERALDPPVGCDWDAHDGRAVGGCDERGVGEDVRVLQMLLDRKLISVDFKPTLI